MWRQADLEKTTLCKILSGYEKPDSGQVLLDGKPLDFYGSYCPVQLIWQHPEQAINPRLRMRSVLEEGDNVSPDLIKRLGIEADWMNRFPAELSGGRNAEVLYCKSVGTEDTVPSGG